MNTRTRSGNHTDAEADGQHTGYMRTRTTREIMLENTKAKERIRRDYVKFMQRALLFAMGPRCHWGISVWFSFLSYLLGCFALDYFLKSVYRRGLESLEYKRAGEQSNNTTTFAEKYRGRSWRISPRVEEMTQERNGVSSVPFLT